MKAAGIFIITIFLITAIISGCGKKKIEAGSPEEIISLLMKYSGTEEVLSLYTGETINEFDGFLKIAGIDRKDSYPILSVIPPGAEVDISGIKTDGDRSLMSVKFIRHPVENMTGFTLEIRLKKEGDNWRMDRTGDFRNISESLKKGGASEYLRNL